jgi:hypothetical protein
MICYDNDTCLELSLAKFLASIRIRHTFGPRFMGKLYRWLWLKRTMCGHLGNCSRDFFEQKMLVLLLHRGIGNMKTKLTEKSGPTFEQETIIGL